MGLYKKVDANVIADMIKAGVLHEGKFVVTDNYLAVHKDDADKAYDYIEDNGYGSMAECMCYRGDEQLMVITINEPQYL